MHCRAPSTEARRSYSNRLPHNDVTGVTHFPRRMISKHQTPEAIPTSRANYSLFVLLMHGHS
jgi:hypothetical protein